MRTTDYTIRRAGFDAAERIFELVRGFPKEVLPRSLGDIVQNIDRFLVCQSGADLVGTVSWQVLPEIGKPKDPSVEIKSLTVAAESHGRGVGRSLVEAAIRHITLLHPAQCVVLTFAPDFFTKLGFHEVPKETLMHKLYAGCINCTKYDNPFTCPEVAMALEPEQLPGESL